MELSTALCILNAEGRRVGAEGRQRVGGFPPNPTDVGAPQPPVVATAVAQSLSTFNSLRICAMLYLFLLLTLYLFSICN